MIIKKKISKKGKVFYTYYSENQSKNYFVNFAKSIALPEFIDGLAAIELGADDGAIFRNGDTSTLYIKNWTESAGVEDEIQAYKDKLIAFKDELVFEFLNI